MSALFAYKEQNELSGKLFISTVYPSHPYSNPKFKCAQVFVTLLIAAASANPVPHDCRTHPVLTYAAAPVSAGLIQTAAVQVAAPAALTYDFPAPVSAPAPAPMVAAAPVAYAAPAPITYAAPAPVVVEAPKPEVGLWYFLALRYS